MCRLQNIALESVTEKCDRWTDRQTDGRRTKWSLCVAMLRKLCFASDTKIADYRAFGPSSRHNTFFWSCVNTFHLKAILRVSSWLEISSPCSYNTAIHDNLKVFPEGLMVDMASKNISSFTVSYTALPMKTDLHFQPTLPYLQHF